ncbi:MAG TPA: cytochrome c biogenesis protein CcsA [Sedimentisphaerales bacterium]|nr:cytochrome c biogenesis protein CcsA [Sedimentisphaerales bacterium]
MRNVLLYITGALILISTWLCTTAAAVAPPDRNIVYVHVPAAISSLVCFAAVFVCSIQYLRTERRLWDFTAAASAEVGLVFATVFNITGMIFAHAQWGTWWTFTPRLVSSAALWFLYAAYCLLRTALAERYYMRRLSAVFGIIAFTDVPLVVISARFIRDIHRPGVTFETALQTSAFILAITAALLLAAVLVLMRIDILQAKAKLETKTEPDS